MLVIFHHDLKGGQSSCRTHGQRWFEFSHLWGKPINTTNNNTHKFAHILTGKLKETLFGKSLSLPYSSRWIMLIFQQNLMGGHSSCRTHGQRWFEALSLWGKPINAKNNNTFDLHMFRPGIQKWRCLVNHYHYRIQVGKWCWYSNMPQWGVSHPPVHMVSDDLRLNLFEGNR